MRFALSLTGLTSYAKALDVIGNNIANSNTAGFKSSKARFADVLAVAGANGGAADSPNSGVSTTIVDFRHTQGSIEQSTNPTDLAIIGNGFLRLEKDGDLTYTRDGQLRLAPELDSKNAPTGKFLLENREQRRITGWPSAYDRETDTWSINNNAELGLLKIDPVYSARATSVLDLKVNLNSQVTPVRDAMQNTDYFNPDDPYTYSFVSPTEIYDANGGVHNLSIYFAKWAGDNDVPGSFRAWDVFARVDDGEVHDLTSWTFNEKGVYDAAPFTETFMVKQSNGDTRPLTINMDLRGSTVSSMPNSKEFVQQDGRREGRISSEADFQIDAYGQVFGNYDNGKSRLVGQLALANFLNPGALVAIGNGQWIQNNDEAFGSGDEIVGKPGSRPDDPKLQKQSGMGLIQSKAKERSNVDLNEELVALIEQQRNYQANAQTFKILDQVLQNLAQIR